MKKTVCVVTGTRAEYGLLRPVIKKIQTSDALVLRLLVTGAHLDSRYGNTVTEIEKDGVPIDAKIPILHESFTAQDTAKITGEAICLYTDYFVKTRPDAVLVLGDRYEIFAAGTAACLLSIPLVHISGGDVTLGAADEWFRHCLTKMASLHFPSCSVYANRLVAMGEEPCRIFNVGGLGDENIRSLPLKQKHQLSEEIGFDLERPYLLITYHPETASGKDPVAEVKKLFAALSGLENIGLIFTRANADAGGAAINAALDEYVKAHDNAIAFTSMGVLNYLSAMRQCSAVVGNSSSGVVEAPSFGVPTVNIGDRQAGRLRCTSIIDCKGETQEIAAALKKALDPTFAQSCKNQKSPYGGGDTSGSIVKHLTAFLNSELCRTTKTFFDAKQDKYYF